MANALKEQGQKDDGSKLRVDLIPAGPLARVLEHCETGTGTAVEVWPTIQQLLQFRAQPEHVGAALVALELAVSACIEMACCELVINDDGHAELNMFAGNAARGIQFIAKVLHYGAYLAPRPNGTKGYGESNWQQVADGVRRYYAAMLRHLLALAGGQENDPESGLPHAAHAATCGLFLLHVLEHPSEADRLAARPLVGGAEV